MYVLGLTTIFPSLCFSGRTSILFNKAIEAAKSGRFVHFVSFREFQHLPLLLKSNLNPQMDVLQRITIT